MRKSIFLLLVMCLLCVEIPWVVKAEEISKSEGDIEIEKKLILFLRK